MLAPVRLTCSGLVTVLPFEPLENVAIIFQVHFLTISTFNCPCFYLFLQLPFFFLFFFFPFLSLIN